MSLGSLGRLGIEIYADTAQFTGDLGKVERAAASMGASITGSLGGVIKGLGALGIGLAAVDFISKTRDALDHADALGKLAQKTGLAVDELSRMSYAAKLADVSNETLAKGIKGLSEKMVEANDVNSESARLFAAIGVDLKRGISPAMEKLADQFAALPDGATKTALAVKLFGKAGQEMIPFLNGGAEGMRRLKDEAAALGITIDKDTAAAAERFNDNMRAMKTGAEALGNSLATKTAAALADVTDAMKEAYKESGFLLAAWVALGGVAAKIFTDESQSDAEKVAKRMNELRAELAGVRQRLIDSQEVMGPWGEKLRESLIAAAMKGTLELKQLNDQLIAIKRGQQDAAAAEEQKRERQKAEEKRIRDQLSLEEMRKKAAAEVKAWNERLRQEDLKGWVAYADEQIKTYDAQLAVENKLTEDYYREKDRMQELDAKGWVAKIEKETAEYNSELLELAKITENFYRERDRIREHDTANQLKVYDELGTRLGDFFADLVVNGKSAFDRLRDSLKQFAAELIALFAKKFLLNMVGNFLSGQGVTLGAELLKMGASAGQGTMAGTLIGSPLGMAAAIAAGGYGLGNFGAKALGAGERGQQVGGITGALFGGLIGAIVGKFTDPDGLAQRSAKFGGGGSNYWHGGGSSAFGGFGITDDKWFSDADMLAKVQEFQKGLAAAENAFAKFLKTDEIARVTAALGNSKQYNFGTEHGDFSGTLGQILRDRVETIFNTIDPALKKWLEGFQGTGDELIAYATDLLNVRAALADANLEDLIARIPDLTLEGLDAMREAGESLGQTMQRVVEAFLTAQDALNQAIASRNPQFARDLVLGQRNNLGAQFAASIGQTYDGTLAAQMALNPQSFTGLNTLQMGMLAQWLGLQTQLEQLDQQLAQNANAAANVTTSFNNAATAADDYAARLHDSQTSLADFLRGAMFSGSSPLDPQAKYELARQQLNQQFTLADAGSLDAIAGLPQFLQQFWDASQAVNASGPQYNTDYFASYARAAALTGGQIRPFTAADAQVQTAALVAALTATTQEQTYTNALIAQYLQLVASGRLQTNDPAVAAILAQLLARVGGTGVLASSGAL